MAYHLWVNVPLGMSPPTIFLTIPYSLPRVLSLVPKALLTETVSRGTTLNPSLGMSSKTISSP
jgi:hypothetical protein